MKLLQSYSRNSSVDIKHRPFLYQKFYPLGNIDKYITIQTKSGMPAKDYDHFQEVVNLLFPVLEKQGIKILHLGLDSPPLNNTINLNGATSIGQSAYIIKRSLCHLSIDSWSCHFAGAEEVPLIALYGSTTVENHSPYHFNPDITIFLESHRNGNKASYQREESPKTINFLNPEDVCSAVCKLLKLEWNFSYKTLKIGVNFNQKIVESSMDSVINISALGINNIICRLDYCWNLQNLINQASVGKVSIVTDKVIPTDILSKIQPNIIELLYEIKLDNDPNFCKTLQSLKIPYRLFSKLNDEQLNPIKLNYLDFPVINRVNTQIPEILKDKVIENIYIKGSKYIVSQKGLFNSYWGYKNSRPIPNFDVPPQRLVDINIQDLGDGQDYLYFLEKI